MAKLSLPKRQAAVWNRLFINGAALPGIIQRLTVGGNLRMDTETIAGKDGVIIGNADWSEDTAMFELIVLRTELSRMREFRDAYKNRPGIKPVPVSALHPLLEVLGVRKMILSKVEFSWESSLKDRVPVRVELTNITPKKDRNQPGTRADGSVAPTAIKPGESGLSESNEIVGQPETVNPTPPGLPAPGRTP